MYEYLTESEIKRNRRITVLLLLTMPFVLLLVTLKFFSFVEYHKTAYELKKYQPLIDSINEYKKENDIYPDNIEKIEVNSKKFPYYTYETYNNKQDYIFLVNDSEYDPKFPSSGIYRYCSNINLDDCNPEINNRFVERYTVDNWVVTYYID